jgi:hypothetical protein
MASFKQIAVNRLNAPRNSDPVRLKLPKLGWSAQASLLRMAAANTEALPTLAALHITLHVY